MTTSRSDGEQLRNDLDAIDAKWLQPCGACDAGLPSTCTHPDGDYRATMASLVEEIEQLRLDLGAITELTVADRPYDWRVAQIRDITSAAGLGAVHLNGKTQP